MHCLTLRVVVAAALASGLPVAAQTPFELRDLGLAQLENDRPEEAAATFQRLAEARPDDPLPWANLAIANLRRQQPAEARRAVQQALERDAGRPDLLGVAALVAEWEGELDRALETAARAAARAPDDVRLQFQLLRLADIADGRPAESVRKTALDRLAALRPENLAVLFKRAQAARAAGDRSGLTASLLRVRELLWQAPPQAPPLLERVLDGVEQRDLEGVAVPLAQLENVLRTTAMYRQGVRELDVGILGEPVMRFAEEPPPSSFGDGIAITLRARKLSPDAVGPGGLAVGDFDGDGQEDLAWAGVDGAVTVRWGGGGEKTELPAAEAAGSRLAASDLDDDGISDLLQYGGRAPRLFLGNAERRLGEDSGRPGPRGVWTTVTALDYDIEGDLDLVVAGPGGVDLRRNALTGPLESVGRHALPSREWPEIRDLVVSDLDRDGDLDLVVVTADGLVRLDNLRQGRFVEIPLGGGPRLVPAGARAAVAADLDNDGWPDLVVAGRGLTLLRNDGGDFVPWPLPQRLATSARFDSVVALDADLDGRLDLAVTGPQGTVLLLQRPGTQFEFVTPAEVAAATSLVGLDLDGDGDEDLVEGGERGLRALINQGGNRNHWLAVQLRGLTDGSSKNNAQGRGSVLEVRNGTAYQFREVSGPVTRFGLGRQRTAQVLRVVWTNGVPQNRLDIAADSRIVEEQVLKGSCPFLYTWDGERIRFVTDLLWNTMLGMPLGEGVWAPPTSTEELVRIDGAVPRDGRYDLRVTGELWEAFYFDRLELWVVDHPPDVEVASNLYVRSPGTQSPPTVLATRELRPLAGAWTGDGEDVRSLLAERDESYARAFEPSRYQGVAVRPWSLTLDLGEAPAVPVRLVLESWLFPPDASLNLATAQRPDLATVFPRLEVETEEGWQTLVENIGLPAGKTKPMVVDTPPLPAGARRLRIVSTWWVAYDRVLWSTETADATPRLAARLAPAKAELRYRGFSAIERTSPAGPHTVDYARVRTDSPWLPMPGEYTRYGDVRPLLTATDSRTVIVGAGDELALEFDAAGLPVLPVGWRRTVFLESEGWGKDADRNTLAGQVVGPLPFHGMWAYPYEPEQAYPEELEAYRREWLTRRVPP
ncbi:MAG: FG-GAP-like repeat-containing protein [Thermoanaerobaculia bacterium]